MQNYCLNYLNLGKKSSKKIFLETKISTNQIDFILEFVYLISS